MGSLIETAGRIIGQVQVALEDAQRKFIPMNPLACGTTTGGIDVRDDAPPEYLLDDRLDPKLKRELRRRTKTWVYLPAQDLYIPYESSLHGDLASGSWLGEGDPIPGIEPFEGKVAVHRHQGQQWFGPWRYEFEEPKEAEVEQ